MNTERYDRREIEDTIEREYISYTGHRFAIMCIENEQVKYGRVTDRLFAFIRDSVVFDCGLTFNKPVVMYPELKALSQMAVALKVNPERFAVVLCNLYACELSNTVLAVPLNHHTNNESRLYAPIIKKMEQSGLVRVHTGFSVGGYKKGKFSRIAVTPKLQQVFSVVKPAMLKEALPPAVQVTETLKNGEKRRINKRGKPFAVKLAEETVEAQNKAYSGHYFTYYDDVPFFPYLSVIYCQNSWHKGGRYYSYGRLNSQSYQQMSQSERLSIRIDGEDCTELDISGLHPNLLYAEKGLQFQGDVYGFVPKSERKLAKQILLIALNEDSTHGACLAFKGHVDDIIRQDRAEDREPLKDTQRALLEAWQGVAEEYNYSPYRYCAQTIRKAREYHDVISDFFCSGVGVILQHKDSQIMGDILRRTLGEGIICLPVHDSVVCPVRHKDRVKQIMESAYYKHTGFTCTIEEKK